MNLSAWLDTADHFFDRPLAKAVGAVIVLYLAYRFGLLAYFRQKEAEHARQRYLDQGLDLAASQVDYALSVFRNNWTLALRYLQLYREAPIALDISEFFSLFRELDQERFQLSPVHRISAFLDDPIVWNGYQSVFAFVGTQNNFLRVEFGRTLAELAPNAGHPKKETFIKDATEKIVALSKKTDSLYIFTSELMSLARVFERQALSPKDFDRFRTQPEVEVILRRLHEQFPDWAKKPAPKETPGVHTTPENEARGSMTTNTVEIRAQIDTEQVRALQLINGGTAAGLMTILPTILQNPGLRQLAGWTIVAIGLAAFGLFSATVHNRLRRKCSLEYDRGPDRQPATRWALLRVFASVPNEPQVCTFSVMWMWTSMLMFIAAGGSIAYGASKVIVRDIPSTSSCWSLETVSGQAYKFNTCTGDLVRL